MAWRFLCKTRQSKQQQQQQQQEQPKQKRVQFKHVLPLLLVVLLGFILLIDLIFRTTKKLTTFMPEMRQQQTTALLDDQGRHHHHHSDNNIYKRSSKRPHRFLIGIFTMDSPKEALLRTAHRQTHLSYFLQQDDLEDNEQLYTICSLQELLQSSQQQQQQNDGFFRYCRIVYTFVFGGGDATSRPGICYWGEDKKDDNDNGSNSRSVGCTNNKNIGGGMAVGGRESKHFVLNYPEFNFSQAMELKHHHHHHYYYCDTNNNNNKYPSASLRIDKTVHNNYDDDNTNTADTNNRNDMTFLSIRESMRGGKSETWFTYAAAVTMEHPELEIDFIVKMDSDTVFLPHRFLQIFQETNRDPLVQEMFFSQEQKQNGTSATTNETNEYPHKYIYAGHWIPKPACVGRTWGFSCKALIPPADGFTLGMFYMVSSELAQTIFLDDTPLEYKQSRYFPGHEDISMSNLILSKNPYFEDESNNENNNNITHKNNNDTTMTYPTPINMTLWKLNKQKFFFHAYKDAGEYQAHYQKKIH